MKKKKYIAPDMEVIEMNIETALMSLSTGDALPGTSWGGSVGGDSDIDPEANRRRGSWGNLWESESKSR